MTALDIALAAGVVAAVLAALALWPRRRRTVEPVPRRSIDRLS